jgi:hypothetical protein
VTQLVVSNLFFKICQVTILTVYLLSNPLEALP